MDFYICKAPKMALCSWLQLLQGYVSAFTGEVRADESLFTYSIDTAINKHFLVPKLYFEKLVKQRNGTTEEFCWEPICCTAFSVAEVFVGNDNFTWATHVEEYYFEYRQHYIVGK